MRFTLKESPLQRTDLDAFVARYNPANRHVRVATWSAEQPEGRWRPYHYEELIKRDKVNLDLFWLKDRSLEDSASLPEPEALAAEIADNLQAALDGFRAIAAELGGWRDFFTARTGTALRGGRRDQRIYLFEQHVQRCGLWRQHAEERGERRRRRRWLVT